MPSTVNHDMNMDASLFNVFCRVFYHPPRLPLPLPRRRPRAPTSRRFLACHTPNAGQSLHRRRLPQGASAQPHHRAQEIGRPRQENVGLLRAERTTHGVPRGIGLLGDVRVVLGAGRTGGA